MRTTRCLNPFNMKKLLLLVGALLSTLVTYSQIQYHATEVSQRSFDSQQRLIKGPFKPVSVPTIINLYNNALTVRGDREISVKFVRKTNMIDKDGSSYILYKGLESDRDECSIIINDYGTYSRIGIYWPKSNFMLVYQTM